jgi:citrate lyase subunit beta / citryl-CoA lyase
MKFRARRSVLYMPGSNARAIEKARTLRADCIILDLEDSVAPDAKESARHQVSEAITAGGFGRREVIVRLNGIDTRWWAKDLAQIAAAGPDAILVPKVSKPEDLQRVDQELAGMQAEPRIRVWAMMESPLAMLNARDIAAVADDPRARLAAFVMGTNDLAKETRARIVPGRAPMLPWLMTSVAAARAYGIDIIDGVHNDLGDPQGFAAECAQARDLGFDGKTLIHPNQIEACNLAFAPGAEEIAQARRLIDAFDRPENKDKGVIALDGRMVERLHADMARRTVAIAEAIESMGANPSAPGP